MVRVSHRNSGAQQKYRVGDELKSYAQIVTTLMPTRSHLTEFDVARSIERLPLDISVFMGNSLIVRLADMLTNPLGIETYSNRGASGIDGLVASANGVHRDKGKSMVLYLGDTSLLYDLNSLSLFSRTQVPCVIVVTNNDGGRYLICCLCRKTKKYAVIKCLMA